MTGAAAGFLFALAGVSAARTLTLADLRREVTISDPQISPDGKSIAVLVARQDFDHDVSVVRLFMVDVQSGRSAEFNVGSGAEPGHSLGGLSSVHWSPAGDRLGFLATRGNGPKQLYVVSASGAGLRKLTAAPQGVQSYVWRPDGDAIAFASEDAPAAKRGSERFNTSFEVGDNDYLTVARPQPTHLWIVRTDGAGANPSASPLTRGTSIVPSSEGFIEPQHYPNQFFCWVEHGLAIAYTKAPDAYQTHWNKSVMEVHDIASGRERKLTEHAELEAGCDASPDGQHLAYWYPHGGQPLAASVIFVTSATAGDNGVAATETLDRSPWSAQWMPTGRSLLILAHDGTREGMWDVGVGNSVHRIDIGDLSASGASVSRNGAIAFVASGPQLPSELYVLSSTHAVPRRLTNLNGFFETLQLGAVKHIEWTNDSFDENGVLTYPPGFVAGKKYPLVLQIHGWPQYASQEAFDTDYPGLTQLLAAHGYVVFEPNYRGSDNLGSAFESAVAGDTVAGPSSDIMAGIAAVERLGFVDETRIGVSGWSYGGLLTAWLIGHHDWKAAMAGAAPTDNVVDYAISSYNVLGALFLGSPLWESKALHQTYIDQSPITYAWNVHTPTLFMASVFETTVPVVHTYELFHALRDRGVPTQFIAYPSDEHFPSDPVLGEDIYRRWVGWFDKYLR